MVKKRVVCKGTHSEWVLYDRKTEDVVGVKHTKRGMLALIDTLAKSEDWSGEDYILTNEKFFKCKRR